MRILFLTQVLPYPLDAGPKVRAYYVLRYLVERGHQITLLSFVRPNDKPESIEHLRGFCEQVITVPMPRSRWRDGLALGRSLITGQPFLIARDRVPAMAETVQRLLKEEDFDAVHADQLWMAPYALLARAEFAGGFTAESAKNAEKKISFAPSAISAVNSSTGPRLVLDQHNAVFQIPRRLADTASNPLARRLLAREARTMARYEAAIIRQFDHVVWVTAEDREAVLPNQPPQNGHQRFTATAHPSNTQHPIPNTQYPIFNTIIPICIDPERKQPVPRAPSARHVTFLGGLHWPPNAAGVVWFARQVWPRVLQEIPDAILTIIGKDPPKELRNGSHSIRNLEITGYLPDPTPHLAETAVFIVPLHAGGGMRVKILDAWAWGLPVVSTTIGAEGLQARAGENILLADDAGGFARAVVQVLRDPGLGERLARGGRATVERAYDWRKVYRAWDAVYDITAEDAENAEGRNDSVVKNLSRAEIREDSPGTSVKIIQPTLQDAKSNAII